MLPARIPLHTYKRSSPLRIVEATLLPLNGLDRVRDAGAAFIRGTTRGWSNRDLAEWLVCHYAPCAAAPIYTAHPEREPEPAPLFTKDGRRTVDEAVVEPVVFAARARVLRLLADLVVPWQASPVARLAVASGSVVAERDERGAVAYAPVNRKRMRLGERAASLFIADYLNRQTDYRWVMMCRECGELSFSRELAHSPWCESTPEQWVAFTAAEAIAVAANGGAASALI